MCGTMPSVQPTAATTLARRPRARPGGDRVERPGARGDDDDQRGQQERGAHRAAEATGSARDQAGDARASRRGCPPPGRPSSPPSRASAPWATICSSERVEIHVVALLGLGEGQAAGAVGGLAADVEARARADHPLLVDEAERVGLVLRPDHAGDQPGDPALRRTARRARRTRSAGRRARPRRRARRSGATATSPVASATTNGAADALLETTTSRSTRLSVTLPSLSRCDSISQ